MAVFDSLGRCCVSLRMIVVEAQDPSRRPRLRPRQAGNLQRRKGTHHTSQSPKNGMERVLDHMFVLFGFDSNQPDEDDGVDDIKGMFCN